MIMEELTIPIPLFLGKEGIEQLKVRIEHAILKEIALEWPEGTPVRVTVYGPEGEILEEEEPRKVVGVKCLVTGIGTYEFRKIGTQLTGWVPPEDDFFLPHISQPLHTLFIKFAVTFLG